MATDEVAPSIDIPNENGFVGFFKKMPKSSTEVVRMFNRGDFYTVHGDNAVMVANNFLNTSQALKNIGPENNRLSSVAISQNRYESFLRFLLVDNSYRLEIYSKPSGKNKSDNNWFLDIKASPGCLGPLEEILYGFNIPITLNQNAASLYLDSENNVHFAAVNVIDCTIYLGSFTDNASYTLLESLIVRLNPKECLLPKDMSKDRIKTMLLKNNILSNDYLPSKDSLDNLETVLAKLVKDDYKSALSRIVSGSRQSLIAFNALLDYLNLLNDRFCYSNYHLKEIEPETFVRLDLSSISNLHLFPKNNENKAIHSLYQVLNYCKSASGRKLLNTFIRQPLTNLFQIEQRLDNVEFFRDNLVTTSSLYDHFLPKIPDITKIYKKFTNGRCKLIDVYQVYLIVDQLPLMLNTFDPSALSSSVKTTIYDKIKEVHDELKPFKTLVHESLDFDHFNESRELWIDSSVSEDLGEIKAELDKLHNLANQELDSVRRDLNKNFQIEKDKVKMEIDKFGFFFRVTKQYASCIFRSKQYQEVHSGKVKDSRFLSRGINSVNSQFVEYSEEYNKLQQKFIEKFIDQTRQYMESILKLENVLAFTDVMVSFCKASQKTIQHYCRPKMFSKGSGKIVLKQFRHPIIEILKDMNFVANDVNFDQFKFYVITGPNMGGKSTFIRSVALCVLMAQIGSFVPCEEAEISIVDAIYTRISANDNPTLGLSTFMAEMVEASAIIRSATADSLIVIDELGRSTGIFDGFGIAQGISEYLANTTKAYALFATHFHHLALGIDTVGRLAMKTSFEDGVFVNHYQAEQGTSENSFGIELAKRANMPEQIVVNAAEKLNQMQKTLGDATYYERVIDILQSKLEDKPSFKENNDEQSRQQFLKKQIRQKLLDVDWSQY